MVARSFPCSWATIPYSLFSRKKNHPPSYAPTQPEDGQEGQITSLIADSHKLRPQELLTKMIYVIR